MHIHLNEKMIQQRSKIGRYASTAGLVVLLIGMVATLRGQQYIWVSFAALMIGLVASQVGTYYMRRWGRSPRPDEMLTTALKGLDKRHHFYGWSLPAEYVFQGPSGLFTFVAKDQTGQVLYNNGRWRQPFKWTKLLMLFAQDGLGDPVRDAADQVARLRRLLVKNLGEEEATRVPVQGVVVFMAAGVDLQLSDEPPLPVLPLKKLKDYIRSQGKGQGLPEGLSERLLAKA